MMSTTELKKVIEQHADAENFNQVLIQACERGVLQCA